MRADRLRLFEATEQIETISKFSEGGREAFFMLLGSKAAGHGQQVRRPAFDRPEVCPSHIRADRLSRWPR